MGLVSLSDTLEDGGDLGKAVITASCGADAETTVYTAAERSARSLVMALVVRVLRSSTPKAAGWGGEVQATGSASSSLAPTPGLPIVDRQLPPLRSTNLRHFHDDVQHQTLERGDFKKVPNWSKEAIHGIVERHIWLRQPSEVVVVKIMPSDIVESCRCSEPDDRVAFLRGLSTPEDALGEIGVNTVLASSPQQCPYVLKMLAVFEEPALRRTWLVLENCDCDLFDFVEEQRRLGLLGEHTAKSYTLQLLKAVKYLHDLNIGHRDVSLENLLLKNGELRLMDFGQAVQLHGEDGEALPYFRMAGKSYYRPPECYLPSAKLISHWGGVGSTSTGELKFPMLVPTACTPGKITQVAFHGFLCNARFPLSAVPGQIAMAELCGYTVPPMDSFSCGVVFFILVSQSPPWQHAVLGDRFFAFSRRFGVKELLNHRGKPLSASGAALLEGMLNANPEGRWSVQQCLASSFFED
eukprot:TRINITY_DN46589_c0_g1_i1.p1 TRINITY_DN46589_c0_g1~~TRINITY_DN46589_c0_g1_i1.p1  ORF type:complete len:467 (+),score=73.99 TRINITY_DN46589_c0_g1_i1:86-1486(+)